MKVWKSHIDMRIYSRQSKQKWRKSKSRKRRNIWMSEKIGINKNRWRNVTIAFRMSPEENEELNLRVKLCGYQTRQEYIIESVFTSKKSQQ